MEPHVAPIDSSYLLSVTGYLPFNCGFIRRMTRAQKQTPCLIITQQDLI